MYQKNCMILIRNEGQRVLCSTLLHVLTSIVLKIANLTKTKFCYDTPSQDCDLNLLFSCL